MKELTNKELLEIILEQGKKNAREQFDFACKVSVFMNEQITFNTEIKNYLENNTKTNQRGIVEQVRVNTSAIEESRNQTKVQRAKDGFIGGVVASIIASLIKIFG